MKAKDKENIHTLLHTAQDYINGYKSPFTMPSFCDSVNQERIHTLEEIQNAITQCKACRLSKTRNKTVPGEGPAHTQDIKVMVIGEGPGAEENTTGRAFVGKAGQLLDKMLAAIQLSRNTNVFIANIVKCRPPQNREPAPDEIIACLPYLEQQIVLIKPALILCLGRIASQTLLQTKQGITKLRGNFFTYKGIPLLPTYHPSALLHNENLKRPSWEDLKLFKQKFEELNLGEQ